VASAIPSLLVARYTLLQVACYGWFSLYGVVALLAAASCYYRQFLLLDIVASTAATMQHDALPPGDYSRCDISS
jgi:hypothetical protein